MILDDVVGAGAKFVERTIPEIDKELAYWKKSKTVRVVRSRKGVPRSFPIPVRLFRLQVRIQFKSNKKPTTLSTLQKYLNKILVIGKF